MNVKNGLMKVMDFGRNNYLYRTALDMSVKFAIKEVKVRMGREISIVGENNNHAKKEAMIEILKKYDPKFKGAESGDPLGQFKIIPVRSKHTGRIDTFIYYASGEYVFPDSEKAFHYGIKADRQDSYMYIFGKSAEIIFKQYQKCLDELSDKLNNSAIFDCTANKDEDGKGDNIKAVYSPIVARKVETLYYSNHEIDRVLKHIDDFLKNKNFYEERHLLYKTGILLYGAPGTGKSSMVNAIAGVTNRSIINVHVDQFDRMDISAITESVNLDSGTEYIILLEDIDTLFLNRDNKKTDKEDNKVINKMLQFLDSNSSPKNVIFIATTNHIERLDEALLRDGRFDLQVKIELLDRATVKRFCKGFGLNEAQEEAVVKAYKERVGKNDVDRFNPSILQNLALKEIGKNVVIETPVAETEE